MASESKVEWPPQATMPEEIWLTFGDPHWWPTEEEGDIKYVRADAEQLAGLRSALEWAVSRLEDNERWWHEASMSTTLTAFEKQGFEARAQTTRTTLDELRSVLTPTEKVASA